MTKIIKSSSTVSYYFILKGVNSKNRKIHREKIVEENAKNDYSKYITNRFIQRR